jgi:hypothetical protein
VISGMIFVAVEQHLRDVGEDALAAECFPVPGQYIALGEYSELDVLEIAGRISRAPADPASNTFGAEGLRQRPLVDVLRALGEAVPRVVSRIAPALLPRADGFHALLAQLERGEQMLGRALLPEVEVRRRAGGLLAVIDRTPAGLCRFTEGMLLGHAALLADSVAFRHATCRARGDVDCTLVVRFLRAETTVSVRPPARRRDG